MLGAVGVVLVLSDSEKYVHLAAQEARHPLFELLPGVYQLLLFVSIVDPDNGIPASRWLHR